MKEVAESSGDLYAVIMAGGRGKRFWPLSRNAKPKQLLTLTGDASLLRQTVERVAPLIPKERIIVITAQSHSDGVLEVLPDLPAENILIEPEGKNTATALSFAAEHILGRNKSAIMAALPSDHVIEGPPGKFLKDISRAAQTADKNGMLVTFGVRPTRPETGYGYIEVGEKIKRGVFKVRSFKEKPNRKKARDYMDSGRYLWNAGIFVFRCDVLMEKVAEHMPSLSAALKSYGSGSKTRKNLEKFYANAKSVSIDYGIMEKCGEQTAVIGASFKWSDVGSWQAIDELWPADELGNRKDQSKVVALNSRGNTILSKKLVALLGVDDLIIVETDDALLVCKKERSQEIKTLVDEMERLKLTDYL